MPVGYGGEGPSKPFREWTWQEWFLEAIFVIAVSLVGFILLSIMVEDSCHMAARRCFEMYGWGAFLK